ncbi:uncharacterized protein LOC102628796 isoform X3 [Citrus sinensis]|uniref:uncharacterized protein LOC102628796 isoform X3 n=1 Tax=Citrus sinensis TaxID=2711 RepID=UPI00227871F6|nr:uncharacterized protein LOC102628796 isoform X3 [Citrus sinensis]
MKKKHHLHLERSEMILLGLLRPYGRDETVARIVLSSSIDCFGLNRTQVIDSGLIIFLNEFRNRYHARSRFRSFPGDWFRRCGGLRGASAVRKPNYDDGFPELEQPGSYVSMSVFSFEAAINNQVFYPNLNSHNSQYCYGYLLLQLCIFKLYSTDL